MKRAILAGLGIYVGYLELRINLEYWFPSFGEAYGGQVLGQTAILAVLALIVFGSAIALSYRFLNWIFE